MREGGGALKLGLHPSSFGCCVDAAGCASRLDAIVTGGVQAALGSLVDREDPRVMEATARKGIARP